ncbi:MAG TPA: hypothetical protein VF384_05840 [Planctomycetota bacterium]
MTDGDVAGLVSAIADELFTQGARFDPFGALASTTNFDSIVMW